MKKLICYFFGHKWKYNFPSNSMPTKKICAVCKVKYTGSIKVDSFFNENRTDKELIKKWFIS